MKNGEFTEKALSNFQISGITAPRSFIRALGMVKLAAAKANSSLGLLTKSDSKAIEKAATEFMEGKFDEYFVTDVFQAGAGTSYNMNSNEVISQRANKIAGKKSIHPNNHINTAQSTNDVIPTATKIAVISELPKLEKALKNLETQLSKLAKKHKNDLKVGRTHLQDAVPITFGQEFDAYLKAIEKSHKVIFLDAKELQELGIGGTAVGTGINTDPKYKKLVVQNLSFLSGFKLKSGTNLTEMANNFVPFQNLSAALKGLATNLLNLSFDLKLMNTGPKAGFREITLPEVQPGSSIMPGKVNPSILECLDMILFQVCGNHTTIELAAQRSNLELNVFCPVIMHNLLQSIEILTNGINMLSEKALKNLKVNTKTAAYELEQSLAHATALAPYIGYKETAQIVKDALEKGTSIKEEVLAKKLLSEKELKEILSVKRTTGPSKKIGL